MTKILGAFFKKHFWNVFFVVIFVFMLQQRLPSIRHNFKMEGERVGTFSAFAMNGNEVVFPRPQKSVLIFWATWCGPCKVEMALFRSAVINGEIEAKNVFAIDVWENEADVRSYLAENTFPYQVLVDKHGTADKFDITMTPTVVHLEADGRVSYMGSGFNPIAIYKAKNFLNGQSMIRARY